MNEKNLTSNLNWEDLKLFLAVARTGGLSAASQATGKSAPTLGRRVLALEQATGEELFHRQARGYKLTEQGNALLNKVVDLEAQIMQLDRTGDKDRQELVKVSAGSWMTYALCQRADTILQGSPSTRLRFISAEHVLDISHREAVIGIRNQRPDQAGLACRKIGKVQFAGYAVNKDAKSWVRVTGKTPSARWLAARPSSAIGVEVSSPRNALDLAINGGYIVLLPTFIGSTQKGLIRVTAPVTELDHEQWLVTHQDDRFVPEVRKTIDRIYEVAKELHKRMT